MTAVGHVVLAWPLNCLSQLPSCPTCPGLLTCLEMKPPGFCLREHSLTASVLRVEEWKGAGDGTEYCLSPVFLCDNLDSSTGCCGHTLTGTPYG